MSTVNELIYLASQSPRRAELLKQLGVRFELLLPADNEDTEALESTIVGESPVQYVLRVTQAKAEVAQQRCLQRQLPLRPILTSDTTVCLGGQILGKPSSARDAERILGLLSGKTHTVLTAVMVSFPTGLNSAEQMFRTQMKLSRSKIRFTRMSRAQISSYVASGEPMGKAGAYAIQGQAARFIRRIDGSYSAIMGLPLFETAQLLRLETL